MEIPILFVSGMFLNTLAKWGSTYLYQHLRIITSGRIILIASMAHGTIGRQTIAKVDSGDLKYSIASLLPKASVAAVMPYVKEDQYSMAAVKPASVMGEAVVSALSM